MFLDMIQAESFISPEVNMQEAPDQMEMEKNCQLATDEIMEVF